MGKLVQEMYTDNALLRARYDAGDLSDVVGRVWYPLSAADSVQDVMDHYDLTGITGQDFATIVSTSNGQQYLAISSSPMTTGECVVSVNTEVPAPCIFDFELSLSLRARHQMAAACLHADAPSGPQPVPAPINIVSISQSSADLGAVYTGTAGTIVTIDLDSPLPGINAPDRVFLSDLVHVTGVVDSRLNYQNLCIKFISTDRKKICAGFSDDQILPSVLIPAIVPTLGTAKLSFYNNAAGAAEAFGYRFSGVAATSAAVFAIVNGGDAQISGTLVGSHLITTASTAAVYTAGAANGQFELKATARFRLDVDESTACALARGADATTGYSPYVFRTSVRPKTAEALKPRYRMYCAPGMTRPVAEVAAVSKAGTTTATVVTRRPHNLVTGNYVTVKGVRDQVNFASLTTAVPVTVVDASTFTVVFGAAVTANSYGGSVILCNGNIDQQGAIGQAVQTAEVDADGYVTLVGSSAWVGTSIGEYVELHGLVDAGGLSLRLDGPWMVWHTSTTALKLGPVVDAYGIRRSPEVGILGVTNCGGSVILRNTMRIHDAWASSWVETKVSLRGQGTSRADLAIPVSIPTTVTVTGSVAGTVAADAAIGNPTTIGARASNATPAAMSATGDNVAALATMVGALITKPFALPEADWSYFGTLTTNADTPMQAAAGAGIKRYLTAMQVQNTNAVATVLAIKDGASTKHAVSLPASMALPLVINFPTPIQTTANLALNVACGTTGANVLVNAQGFTAP